MRKNELYGVIRSKMRDLERRELQKWKAENSGPLIGEIADELDDIRLEAEGKWEALKRKYAGNPLSPNIPSPVLNSGGRSYGSVVTIRSPPWSTTMHSCYNKGEIT